MPTDVGVVDCMIGFPSARPARRFDFLKPQLRDEASASSGSPISYMFKDDDPNRVTDEDDPVTVTLREMDRFGIAIGLVGLAGSVVDGAGLVWLVATSGAAIQRYTPPRLQGRASAAWTMVVITPQTVSIAAGAALIDYVSYRLMLLAIIAVIGACAGYLLVRPAAEPAGAATGPASTEVVQVSEAGTMDRSV